MSAVPKTAGCGRAVYVTSQTQALHARREKSSTFTISFERNSHYPAHPSAMLHKRMNGAAAAAASTGGGGRGKCVVAISSSGTSSSSFVPLWKRPSSVKLQVQRAPIMPGLTLLRTKKFQRPMQKRRAYGKQADEALKQSSLGQRRRMDGMAKLMARAGKGLLYKNPNQPPKSQTGDTDDESNSDNDNGDDENDDRTKDRPFEPLCVWVSPHELKAQGETEIIPKGIPPKLTTVVRPDEFGVEETVTILQPAPIDAYSLHNVYVPPILAKWLRPQYV